MPIIASGQNMLKLDVKLDSTYVTELKHYCVRNGTIYGEVLRLTVGEYGEMWNFDGIMRRYAV